MDIHFKTLEKINNVKEKINNKVDLKNIIKENFGNAKTRYNEWLSKYHSHFNADELKYLNYVIIAEDNVTEDEIKVFKEIQDTIIETNQENAILTVPTSSQIALMSRKERENFLLSNLVIEKLVNLLSNPNTNTQEVLKIKDIIKDEVRHLKDIKQQNLRISEQVYKDFVDICKKNDLTITIAINSLLLDFIHKFK